MAPLHIIGLVVILGGSRVGENSISLLSRIVAVPKLTILIAPNELIDTIPRGMEQDRARESTRECRWEAIC